MKRTKKILSATSLIGALLLIEKSAIALENTSVNNADSFSSQNITGDAFGSLTESTTQSSALYPIGIDAENFPIVYTGSDSDSSLLSQADIAGALYSPDLELPLSPLVINTLSSAVVDPVLVDTVSMGNSSIETFTPFIQQVVQDEATQTTVSFADYSPAGQINMMAFSDSAGTASVSEAGLFSSETSAAAAPGDSDMVAISADSVSVPSSENTLLQSTRLTSTRSLLGDFALLAVNASWNGLDRGNWNVSGNWSSNSIPTSSDTVTINNGNGPLIGSGVNGLAGSLSLGTSSGGTGKLYLENGGKLTVYGTSAIGDKANSTGSVTVDGTSTAFVSGPLLIGNEGTGNFTVSNGATMTAQNISLGNAATGTGTLTISKASFSLNSYLMSVGKSGKGILNITGGSTVTADGTLYVGENTGSSGTISVSGLGTSLKTQYIFNIGNLGTGALNISGGATVTSTAWDVLIAANSGSTGTVIVENAGSWAINSQQLIVGYNGNADLTVRGGGILSTDSTTTIGRANDANPGRYATLTVTGSGSQWNSSNIMIGIYAGGTLSISDYGSVNTTGNVSIANISSGNANVTDHGSWTIDSGYSFGVGDGGSGHLTIKTGGSVTSGSLATLGFSSTGKGYAIIDGTDSKWTINNNLIVGDLGLGDIKITVGGKTSAYAVTLGNQTGSTGSITVDGTGTVFEGGLLSVGNGGTGNFTVSNNATANIGNNISLGTTATGVGTLNIQNASFTSKFSMLVGEAGTGTLNINSGGSMTANADVSVGKATGSNGTVTVSGAGSSLITQYIFNIGDSGVGTLNISDGATVNSSGWDVLIAAAKGSTGTVAVDNGTWTVNGKLFVGFNGNADLTVGNGGKLATASITTIGWANDANPGRAATVTVMGAGSQWASSDITLGTYGAGNLTIKDSAVVMTYGRASVGNDFNTSQGSVLVDNAYWDITTNLSIGNYGTGLMTLQNGAVVKTYENAFIGAFAGAQGTAVVDASTWEIGGGLSVGAQGAGTLTIQNGSSVSVTEGVYVGYDTNELALATITGAGSRWTIGGQLMVGGFGFENRLVIEKGGFVSSENTVVGGGGEGTLTIKSLGLLETGSLYTDSTHTVSKVYFDNGTLRAKAGDSDSGAFFRSFQSGQLVINSGGLTIDTNGFDISTDQQSFFSGDGGLIKIGAGALTLNGDNAYVGDTTVSAGTLVINGDQTAAAGTTYVTDSATLGGTGILGGNIIVENGGTLTAGDVLNNAGGILTTNGNLTLQTGATANLIFDAAVTVVGTYAQNTDATLNVTLGDNIVKITADSANLEGTLNISGISDSDYALASQLSGKLITVISTTSGITGDFDTVTGLSASSVDYIRTDAFKSDDEMSYYAGSVLAWYDTLAAGHGTFTLDAGKTFEVDIALDDRNDGLFTSGWDGKSLTKKGEGTLVLSVENTFSGDIEIAGGTLSVTTKHPYDANYSATSALGDGTGTIYFTNTDTGSTLLVSNNPRTFDVLTNRMVVAENAIATLSASSSEQLFVTAAASGGVGSALYVNSGGNFTATGPLGFSGNQSYSGAVYTNNATLNILPGRLFSFTGNEAQYRGGAIFAENYSYINVKNASFVANYAGNAGGAIAITSNSSFDATGAAFDDGEAEIGGAIYMSDHVIGVLVSGKITNSHADTGSGMGGAIYMDGGSHLDATGATFNWNSAQYKGGAIYAEDSTAILDNAEFIGNTSLSGTGAAIVAAWSYITADNAKFQGGWADEGGAIYAQNSTIIATGASFTDNYANNAWGSGGGAIVVDDSVVTLNSVTFTGNNTAGLGGAINVKSGTLSIGATSGDTLFSGNKSGTDNVGSGGTANAVHFTNENGASIFNLSANTGNTIQFLDPVTSDTATEVVSVNINSEEANTGTILFSGEKFVSGSADVWSQIKAKTTVNRGIMELRSNAVYGSSADPDGSSYILLAPATLVMSGVNTKLLAGNSYEQYGTFNVDIAGRTGTDNPNILAGKALIDSEAKLNITGYGDTEASDYGKASLIDGSIYTFIRTSSSITGEYAEANITVNGSALNADVDYITGGIFKNDAGTDYNIGYRLTWNETVSKAHGNFTLDVDKTFEVDVVLDNRIGTFDSGWDGKSLTKNGGGTLVLSTENSYTGGTNITGGNLEIRNANALSSGTVTFTDNATLRFGSGTDGMAYTSSTAIASGKTAVFDVDSRNGINSITLRANIGNTGTLNKTGDALMVLDGASGNATVSVTGGSVKISGASGLTGALIINSGTSGYGNGIYGGSIEVKNGGALYVSSSSDGSMVGTLSVGNNVTLESGSSLLFKLDNASSFSILDLGGSILTANGASLFFDTTGYTGDWADQYTIFMNATGGNDCFFDALELDNESKFIDLGDRQYYLGTSGSNIALIAISSIPETSTYALWAGFAVMGSMLLRRRVRRNK